MKLLDIIKYEINNRDLVYKYPTDEIRLGSQLIVYTGQTAFLVKDGIICDQFNAGNYTISTNNIPLLNKLINIPFGKETPFKAEVWFVNNIVVLDSKWGTSNPIHLEDPKYDVIVPVRAFGQYGLKVDNPQLLLQTLVGNMPEFSREKVDSYFKGKLLSLVTNLISEKITKDKTSILTINSHLNELSDYIQTHVHDDFIRYGLDLVNFYFISINVPENDPSFIKLKEAKDFAARLKITGRDVYQMERSFDVLDKAASNESGTGNIMTMGVGLGAGINVGNQIGNLMSQNFGISTPPPISQKYVYYVVINGQQNGPYDEIKIINLYKQGVLSDDSLLWKTGLSSWSKLCNFSEFTWLLNSPPPIPNND